MKRKLVAGVLGSLVVALGVALGTIDRWLFEALDPGPFDASATPPAPDYDDPRSWAALPGLEDGADVALDELPAVDPSSAKAAVFYLHPTTWLGRAWNAPTDDPAVAAATDRGGTEIQASVFNGCCAVYAPRYRQANGRAFTQPGPEGKEAIDVAFSDVSRAFEHFVARTEGPFFIAGHSQGSILGARLIVERVAAQPVEARLVAAYLPGANVRDAEVGLPACGEPTQVGCVASWNARGPRYIPNGLELDAGNPDARRGRVCVNPITWRADSTHASAEQNPGAVFFDAPEPRIKPAFADAQCRDGTLVVGKLGDLERDWMSRILLWTIGPENYHPVEYQLYYVSLRKNAVERLAAFRAGRKP